MLLKHTSVTHISLFVAFGLLLIAAIVISFRYRKGKSEPSVTTSFGSDKSFLSRYVPVVELSSGKARLLVIPAWQGRVMTSSANGYKGKSYGWINYKLIESGQLQPHINAFGGEERLWLGPEGGPFSLYFSQGEEQVFENWQVPPAIDTEPFEIVSQSDTRIDMTRMVTLTNYSGHLFDLRIDRSVRLLNDIVIKRLAQVPLNSKLSMVGYESVNTLVNTGTDPWTEQTGLLSVWMLSMFTPSPEVVVFIPFDSAVENATAEITSDYFGPISSERLKVGKDVIYFKADGKSRGKLGLSPRVSKGMCGSYDAQNRILTLLWYNKPTGLLPYVNSKWGEQSNPFKGDALNAYNDGPVEDGSQMGPFYELESSSPAAALQPGDSISHIQTIIHLEGDEKQLDAIVQNVFHVSLNEIKNAFK